MVDRSALRSRVRVAAKELASFGRKLEKECARMNDGLTAIAVALAVVTVLTAAVKVPVLVANETPDTTMLQDQD
jgi:predicted benzoate:H+ symporter BenE